MREEVVVFDLDGVLADSSHRQKYLPDWKEFYKHIPEDPAIEPMLKLAELMYWEMDYGIIILTSRPEYAREDTEIWLGRHKIPFDMVIMRPEENFDPTWKLNKLRELRDDYIVHFIFEDDPKNIGLFKGSNLPIVPIASFYYEEVS